MIQIILADDHKMFLQGLNLILNAYKDISIIGMANDGLEVQQMISKHPPDILIMDVNMPKMNGYETALILRKKNPDIKIIALTMLNDRTSTLKMFEAGVKAYLFKNTDELELIHAIQKVNNGEYYINSGSEDLLEEFIRNEKDRKMCYIQYKKHELSIREIEILKYIMSGFSNQEIADQMILSPFTIDTHRKNMLSKLKLKKTASLIKYAMENKSFLGIE